jgi:HK97 family phage major capsid protein
MPTYNPTPLSREDIGALFVQPVEAASVAFRTSTTVTTEAHTFRIPVVSADPTAAWTAEGAEIPVTDPTLTELVVTPTSVKGLVVISRELAEDSSPAAAEVVGAGLARDVARKIDTAWVGDLAAPAQKGLNSLVGVTAVSAGSIAGGTVYVNLDPVSEALSRAEEVGATVDTLVMSPATALRLARIKTAPTGSNEPLLHGRDVTEPGKRTILGVPVLVQPDVAADVIWAYDSSRVFTVLRDDVDVRSDSSVYFSSDRVAVRVVARVGFGFPHAASVVKIAPVA